MTRSSFVALALAIGCAGKAHPEPRPRSEDVETEWGEVVKEAANGDHVDYAMIERNLPILEGYLAWVGDHGPELDEMKESQEDLRIAFMVNAYNAAAIHQVLTRDVRSSVLEIEHPLFKWDGAGFEHGTLYKVDGEWMSLHYLAQQMTIARYQSELIYAALHVPALGGPRLRWWTTKKLDKYMAKEMRRWVRSRDGLRAAQGGWKVSEFFVEHERDLVEWGEASSLCSWLAGYTDGQAHEWLLAQDESCQLETFEYDWTLDNRAVLRSQDDEADEEDDEAEGEDDQPEAVDDGDLDPQGSRATRHPTEREQMEENRKTVKVPSKPGQKAQVPGANRPRSDEVE